MKNRIATLLPLIIFGLFVNAETLKFYNTSVSGDMIYPAIKSDEQLLHCEELCLYEALVSNDTLYLVSDKSVLFNDAKNCMRITDLVDAYYDKPSGNHSSADSSADENTEITVFEYPPMFCTLVTNKADNTKLLYNTHLHYGVLFYANVNGSSFEYGPLKVNAKWHDIEDALMWNGLKPAEVKTIVIVYPSLVNDPWWGNNANLIPRQLDNLFGTITINLADDDTITSFVLSDDFLEQMHEYGNDDEDFIRAIMSE